MEKLSVLNPESWAVPQEVTALNPRLDALSGKTIAIVGQGHSPMLYLKDALLSAVPDIKDVVILGVRPGRQEWAHTGLAAGFSRLEGFIESQKEEISEFRPDAVIQGVAH